MSLLKRDRAAKRLTKLLALAADDPFVELLWALNATSEGRNHRAERILNFPESYFDGSMNEGQVPKSWELETLFCERLLSEPLTLIDDQPNRVMNCRSYSAAANFVNALRDLENEEAGCYLERLDILIEMNRIAHRQFPAQAGYFNRIQFYRYGYIFGGTQCQEYFLQKNRLTMDALAFVAFGLQAHFQDRPTHPERVRIPFGGITDVEVARALDLLTIPTRTARMRQREMLSFVTGKWGYRPPTAFRPCILRQHPVLKSANDGLLRCPLPEFLSLRVTAGLYYDLVDAPFGNLRNEAGRRFERYCFEYSERMFSDFRPREELEYRVNGRPFKSPDVLCLDQDDTLRLAIECKASKLTFDAQYAADPIKEASRGYEELANGIFQIWRFFAHAREGKLAMPIADDALGLVVTLDAWLNMDTKLRVELLRLANELADKEPLITSVDRRPVIITHINEYEAALMNGDEHALLQTLRQASSERFSGWALTSVQRENTTQHARAKRAYPFDPAKAFPFFDAIDDEAEARGRGRPGAEGLSRID